MESKTNLGYPWLVPHDADPNHTPTMKNGEKSHWGVVTGFCVGLNQSSNIKGKVYCCDFE